ncbi:hypothetical protein V5029_18640, partial [Enterobacter hormaechei]|uniref:hypothetical protein n=1 Tax=Enterobacter hormaechei TaxID=158836 RepID=UPI0030763E0A
RVWRRLLENSLSAKVSCWLIRLLILGSGYNTMISHLGLIRTFPRLKTAVRYLFLILPPPLEEGFLTTHSSATPVSTSGAFFNNTRAAAGCHK